MLELNEPYSRFLELHELLIREEHNVQRIKY